MARIIVRLALLSGGMAAVEIGLGSALVAGSIVGWALVLLIGFPMLIGGSAGFMVPLLGGVSERGPNDA